MSGSAITKKQVLLDLKKAIKFNKIKAVEKEKAQKTHDKEKLPDCSFSILLFSFRLSKQLRGTYETIHKQPVHCHFIPSSLYFLNLRLNCSILKNRKPGNPPRLRNIFKTYF